MLYIALLLNASKKADLMTEHFIHRIICYRNLAKLPISLRSILLNAPPCYLKARENADFTAMLFMHCDSKQAQL